MSGRRTWGRRVEEETAKGLLWRLPAVRSKDLGKLGPAIGYGAGCGVGFGFGLTGGAGFGAGLPGLQFVVGIGAGCGIGIGFGYGVGKGIVYDGSSNAGKLFFFTQNLPTENQMEDLVDEFHQNTRNLIENLQKILRSGDE